MRGLDRFREAFSPFNDRYAIIGGTACQAIFDQRGLPFRATKDIDLVLCLETMDPVFARAIWRFVGKAKYTTLETEGQKPRVYRFAGPRNEDYPAVFELFSRVPDALSGQQRGHLTPIPAGEGIASLSAILLEDVYYRWIHAGRVVLEDISVVRAEHLIPLKARAWLDMTERKLHGHPVDGRAIRKHRNDVLRLSQVIDPAPVREISTRIRDDMRTFLEALRLEKIEPKALGLGKRHLDDVVDDLWSVYITRSGAE